MRERLTKRKKEADVQKSAELTDPNQLGREDRVNPPLSKYETYKFTENHPLPDLKHDWKKDKRNEVGLPAPMKEAAVRKARLERDRLEKETHKKAEACLKIAEMILPEAEVQTQEDQAVALMDLPTDAVVETLRRKYQLLENIEAAKKADDATPAPDATVETKEAFGDACEKCQADPCICVEEVTAELTAEDAAPISPDEAAIEFTSDEAILDEIFMTKETSIQTEPTIKKEVKKEGAKKLGNVKKASMEANLAGLWRSAPNVDDAFGI